MKALSKLFLWVALLVNQFAFVSSVLAQEATDTLSDAPTQTEVVPTTPFEQPTNSPQPTTTPEETTPINTPTPIVEQTVVTPTEIPLISPVPSPEQVQITPTITLSLTPTPVLEQTTEQSAVLEMVPVEIPKSTVVIVVENTATITQESSLTANTGGNQINSTNDNQSTVNSGKAVALANLVNIANTNNIGSQVKVYLLNNVDGSVGQIDLNTAWNILASGQSNTNILTIDQTGQNNIITLDNYGTIQNQVTATANSGGNQIDGGDDNLIQTGDAYALVNIVNLLNTNFIGSQVFLGILNLNGSTLGDLILPNPDYFLNQTNGGQLNNISGSINNSANITSDVVSLADSGNNQIINSGGDSSILTGNSEAITKVLTLANINLINGGSYMLDINTLGNWTGKIYNWGTPGSVIDGSIVNFSISQALIGGGLGDMVLDINNLADIQNSVLASANTGNNTINSAGTKNSINTGQAWSSANITNMANLNLINSNWFYGVINIIGDWDGNAIFAYPDLALAMSASDNELMEGENLNIFVNYSNIGYDNDLNATINVTLPNGLEYEGDNSGVQMTRSGNNLSWLVGQMLAKSEKSFTINTKLVNDQEANGLNLIKEVRAADNNRQISVNGVINASKTEVTTDNNNASVMANIIFSNQNSDNYSETTLWPKLRIDAQNNVNNFVYSGDVVTFQINGKNEGEAMAYRTFIVHKIYNSRGILVLENTINIGNVDIRKSGKVTFGVPINFANKSYEKFTSETVWIGYTQNNEEVRSNIAETSFMIKNNQILNLPKVAEVQAVKTDQKVLGFSTEVCQPIIDLLPYILLFIVSAFWLLKQTARWLDKK